MSKFGLKIKNYEAGILYEYNLGLREYLNYTNAMLSNSLLLDFLKEIGLQEINGSTRDVICLKFGFGTSNYEETVKKLENKLKEEENQEKIKFINELIAKAEKNKDKFIKKSSAELREEIYRDGITIEYTTRKSKKKTKIKYRMLYRTPGKAKEGSCMFINEDLFERAQEFIRMGIKLSDKNAPIVEIGAYQSLVSSSIVERIKIKPEEILVLKDVDSYFNTDVIAIETNAAKECVARHIENYRLKNVLFDGQALIDESIFPNWAEGYILLRHHFCKMAAFNTSIQQFFKDYYGGEYHAAIVKDMFGRDVKVDQIKLITTDNALKYLKFDIDYDYWADWVRKNGCQFGIVKTAHESKLGNLQRMSYQMVNTMDMAKMPEICQISKDYIEKLKKKDDFFIDYLRKNINFANDFEVLLALVEQDRSFIDSEYFRERRYKIINDYIFRFKNGKLLQEADNLVIVGNPFGMLMHAVGEDPLKDPTFSVEDGAIQCYTERFEDGEYLASFRSPFNSQNNIGHLHNTKHELLRKYCHIGKQCIAVNLNGTDFQARSNGLDIWPGSRVI